MSKYFLDLKIYYLPPLKVNLAKQDSKRRFYRRIRQEEVNLRYLLVPSLDA